MHNCRTLFIMILILLVAFPQPYSAQPGGPGNPPAELMEAYGNQAPGGFKPPQVMPPAGLPAPVATPQPAPSTEHLAEVTNPDAFQTPGTVQVAQTPEEFAAIATGYEQEGRFAEALEARLASEALQAEDVANCLGLIRCLDQLGRLDEASARLADLLPSLAEPRERWMLDEILWHQLLELAASPDQLAWSEKRPAVLETLQTIIQTAKSSPIEEAIDTAVNDLFSSENPASLPVPDVAAEIALSTALLMNEIQAIPDRPVPGLESDQTEDLSLLQIITERLPVHVSSRLQLASLFRSNQPEIAENLYQEVLTLRPLDPRPMMRLAEMDTTKGDFAIARDRIRQILGFQPEHKEALAFIALLDRLEEEIAAGASQGDPRDGFIPSDRLLVKEDGSTELREDTWLHQANDTGSKRLHKFPAGTQLRVLARVDGWIHVLEVTTLSLLDSLIQSH